MAKSKKPARNSVPVKGHKRLAKWTGKAKSSVKPHKRTWPKR